jgi:cytochrome c peroxidase
MRPTPEFVKAYMHNGYFKSLKEVVHFYNTRDVLPKCEVGDPAKRSRAGQRRTQPTSTNDNSAALS